MALTDKVIKELSLEWFDGRMPKNSMHTCWITTVFKHRAAYIQRTFCMLR